MSAVPELRRAALIRAGSMRDPRVAEVLRRSVVHAIERAAEAWESSDGTVHALDVRLEVDGYALGICDAFPSVRDAVIEALSAEAQRVLGASITDLAIAWELCERTGEGLYRDEVPARVDRGDGEQVRRALIGFVRASGDEVLAEALGRAELDVGSREIDVLHADVDLARIEQALTTLYARPMRARAR